MRHNEIGGGEAEGKQGYETEGILMDSQEAASNPSDPVF